MNVRADTPLLEVLHLFVEAQIGGAPVVDDRGAICGIISSTDLLTAIDQAADEDIDEGEVQDDLEDRIRAMTAIEIATPEVVWVDPDTTAAQVARRMRAEGIHRVVVGTDGRLAGMLTTFDLLAAVHD